MSSFMSTGCVLLHVVFSIRCCDCGPKEPVCSVVLEGGAQDYTPAP